LFFVLFGNFTPAAAFAIGGLNAWHRIDHSLWRARALSLARLSIGEDGRARTLVRGAGIYHGLDGQPGPRT